MSNVTRSSKDSEGKRKFKYPTKYYGIVGCGLFIVGLGAYTMCQPLGQYLLQLTKGGIVDRLRGFRGS